MYVGVDVSKNWLDMAVLSQQNELLGTERIKNTVEAIQNYVQSLRIHTDHILFCLENTGRYGNSFLEATTELQLKTWLEHPLQIKRSLGMTRGKTDQQDAIRIAQYAFRFHDRVIIWKPEEKVLLQLRELRAKRSLVVKSYTMLKQGIDKSDSVLEQSLKSLRKAIAELDARIESVIAADKKIAEQYKLLQTIPGIGKVVATNLLITTKGFTILTDQRKLACYMGIAPFPYQSGSSIHYRSRVSKLGDHKLKALLNLSAWNAIRSVKSLKDFFERKIAQGKHKLSVINAIRNKLLGIVLSVIRRNQPFSEDYSVAVS